MPDRATIRRVTVDEMSSQQPGSGEARIRVEAASVTRDHYTFMSGQQFRGHGFIQPKLPTRLGYEAAGVVEAVGDGVDQSWIGKRVLRSLAAAFLLTL